MNRECYKISQTNVIPAKAGIQFFHHEVREVRTKKNNSLRADFVLFAAS